MTTTAPKLGRPRLPAGKARTGRALSVKLSGEEWAALDRLCVLAPCRRATAVRVALAYLLSAVEGGRAGVAFPAEK